MRSNLALPTSEGTVPLAKPGDVSDAKQLKASVTALGWLIYRFAKNPIFKEADVIETQAAIQARRSLEEIIQRSDWIKKSGEKLGKTVR